MQTTSSVFFPYSWYLDERRRNRTIIEYMDLINQINLFVVLLMIYSPYVYLNYLILLIGMKPEQ